MSRLTDTHCHLNLNSFQDDLPAVLDRAREAGIYRILVPGIDIPTSRAAVELAMAHEEIYAAVGIHPTDADTWESSSLTTLRELAGHPKVVAIGEIGLDYYHERVAHDAQRAVLQAQLELAGELALPVILHNRNSFADVWKITCRWQAGLKAVASPLADRPGVFHSFEGTLEQAGLVAGEGFFLGMSGPITYKNAAERQAVAANTPLANLLLETDAPFLPPQPHRGKRNEPAYTAYIGSRLAELKGLEVEEITRDTADNAARLFVWEPKI